MNKIIGAVAVLALILGGYGALKTDTVTSPDGKTEFGAVFPYSPTPEVNLGGMRLVGAKKSLATGTSTVCAIQSPSSTSTLISAATEFNLASTSAVVFEFSKSTNQYSTSTRIGSLYGIAGSARATVVASTTGSVAGDATIFAPNTWLVGKYYDVNNGVGNASTGQCQVMWAVTS